MFILDLERTAERAEGLVVHLGVEHLDEQGVWGEPRPLFVHRNAWHGAPDVVEREVAQVLPGLPPESGGAPTHEVLLSADRFDTTLRQMAIGGRLRVRYTAEGPFHTVAWAPGEPWELEVQVSPDAGTQRYTLSGAFSRDRDRVAIAAVEAVVRGGLFVTADSVHRFVDDRRFPLVLALRDHPRFTLTAEGVLDLLALLHGLPRLPLLRLPDDLSLASGTATPVPRLRLTRRQGEDGASDQVDVSLAFDYGTATIGASDPRATVFDRANQQLVHRATEAEAAAREAVRAAGVRLEATDGGGSIAASRAAALTDALRGQGFEVDLDGAPLRGELDLEVRVASGIDWFELQGDARFGEATVGWPELLRAARAGDRFVELADGSMGLVPDEWMQRLSLLAATGTVSGGTVRYGRAQAGVLDALLATAPQVDVDAQFARVREAIRGFERIHPADAPPGFHGELRPYQREGLGWLSFLERLGFSGCLADDMGLGKTVQALALLEQRRTSHPGPSLVVVPNSLVFNWQQEAARFTPGLRVFAHVGQGRGRDPRAFLDADLVLTTYGILRRDVTLLARVPFDYVILDEGQAIKNPGTANARSARALRARHRLVMTGTPVENRLSELWSLFEFLNPGVLGASGRLVHALRSASPDALGGVDEEARGLLARALRPYILRRTKAQVAPELPERLEQTVFVDLGEDDRRRYNELRDHYRASLLGGGHEAAAPNRVHVLEALLRLRQAACHPGLVNPDLAGTGSAKLDVLEESVVELVEEGHKVLVFSQFTSLLAIVRRHFDRAGISYEYLDGQTRDREARVTHFQRDPDCHVFLISLKAGGLGLNLTAADYVFLLDPWWNPAVEAQAIDRAHRIGQTRRVFASRLIARDTVEEKVLQLQERKRDLADAIIRAEDGPLSSLTRDDLELLLT